MIMLDTAAFALNILSKFAQNRLKTTVQLYISRPDPD